MFRPLVTTASLRTVSLLRLTALITLFVAVLVPPDASTASGQIATDGGPIADSPTIDQTSTAPSDRSEKWFISIISMQSCGACERLKHDFAHADNLAAFVNVADHRQSWSHYNVYQREDAEHMRRWQNIHVALYPTILIQPPLSGEYGDPRTVVWQRSGYDGNDERLAQEIRAAIATYIARLPQDHPAQSTLANNPPTPHVSNR
jgi:hypothetical protein